MAAYARVSTRDKHQDPEMQMVPIRERAQREGWELVEYIDQASASDLAGRVNWQRMMADAREGRIEAVCVWALDRAFRSVLHLSQTVSEWNALGVGFVCITQQLDTLSPAGRFTLHVLGAVGELERDLIRLRVREGMVNAKRKGVKIGRPSVTGRPGFDADWKAVQGEMAAGTLTHRGAAKRLGIGMATLHRLLENAPKTRPRRRTAKRVGVA